MPEIRGQDEVRKSSATSKCEQSLNIGWVVKSTCTNTVGVQTSGRSSITTCANWNCDSKQTSVMISTTMGVAQHQLHVQNGSLTSQETVSVVEWGDSPSDSCQLFGSGMAVGKSGCLKPPAWQGWAKEGWTVCHIFDWVDVTEECHLTDWSVNKALKWRFIRYRSSLS